MNNNTILAYNCFIIFIVVVFIKLIQPARCLHCLQKVTALMHCVLVYIKIQASKLHRHQNISGVINQHKQSRKRG